MSENVENNIDPSPKKQTSIVRRIGCLVALIIWFAILLLPCFFLTLASQGEIVLQHADIPDPDAHPFLSIGLLSDADYRGFRVINSTIHAGINGNNAICVQTDVRFLLWQGKGENSTYCDCYDREDIDSIWTMTATTPGSCS